MEVQRTSPTPRLSVRGHDLGTGGEHSLGRSLPNQIKQNQALKFNYLLKGKRRPHSIAEAIRRLQANYQMPFLYQTANLSFDKGRKKRAEFRAGMFFQVAIYLLANLSLVNMTVGIHDNRNHFIYRSQKSIARALNTTQGRIGRYLAYLSARGYITTQVIRKSLYRQNKRFWQNDTIITLNQKLFEALHLDLQQLANDQARAIAKYQAIEERLAAKRDKILREQKRIIAKEKRPNRALSKLSIKKHPSRGVTKTPAGGNEDPSRGKKVHEYIQSLISKGQSAKEAFELARIKFPPD